MRILLTPANRSSEKVMECLIDWSRSGLLEPFAWRSDEPGQSPEASTRVTRVEAGESRDLLLGAALQGFGHSNDELIAFYPATPEEGFEAAFVDAAIACEELLAQTIAHDATRPARCTMVVAPSQIGQPVPPGLLSQAFASNVYVAPEDRAEPRDPNRLLGNEEVFPMHAAHAIATVADLWSEPAVDRPSVVDVLALRQPHHQLAIQVVRCFSRGIDFGYLPDHVSAGIFHGTGGWPNPEPERLDRIDDAESVVPHVADDYMRTFRQELGPSEFEPHRLREPEPLGLLEAFRLLVRLIVMRLRRKPFEMVRQRLDSIHDAAADWVERQAGLDSGIRIQRRRGGGGQVDDGLDLDAVLEKPLVVPDGPVAEAWTALRRLVLGLVDGSELPKGIDQARLVNGRGQRALITEPAAIAPDPTSDPPPLAGFAGPICDPLRLEPALAKEAGSDAAHEAVAEWSARHRSSLLWSVGSKLGRALLTARREAQAANVDPPQAANVDPPQEDGDSDDADEPESSSDDERRLLKSRLRRTLVGATLVALAAAALAVSRLALLGAGIALVAIVCLWFLALASAARRWFLADEAIARREDEAELAKLNASLKRSLRMGDEIRLERRYREYLDWAEMLGWLVHRPWMGDPLDRVSLSPPVDHATLPAAFGLGVAEVSEYGLEQLSAAAGAGVFNPGWLAGIYETTEKLEMAEIGIRRGLSSEDAEATRPDPAADVGKDPEGPRRRLLDAVRRGKHRSLSGSELGNEVLRYLGDQEPDWVCERVAVLPTADGATVGERIDALPPPLDGFRPPAALSKLVEGLSPAVVRIDGEAKYRDTGGTGLIVGEGGLVVTTQDVVDGAESISVLTSGGKRLDATLKRTSSDSGLALLTLEADGDVAGVPLTDSVPVFQGDPVIGIGRPIPEHDQPAVAWGLVTAVEPSALNGAAHRSPSVPVLQVAYHRAEGAVGAPLFNLDGTLLGIHCSSLPGEDGPLRSQRISSVIPVDWLRELIDGPDESRPERPAPRRRGPGRQSTTKPSTFIEELTHVGSTPALLRHHWKDAETKNEAKETVPSLEDASVGTERFSVLATDLSFLAPLRILVHRVDLAAPSSIWDLASFPDVADDDDEDPYERVASDIA